MDKAMDKILHEQPGVFIHVERPRIFIHIQASQRLPAIVLVNRQTGCLIVSTRAPTGFSLSLSSVLNLNSPCKIPDGFEYTPMNGLLAVAKTICESNSGTTGIFRFFFNFVEHVVTLAHWVKVEHAAPGYQPSNPELSLNMKVRELKKSGYLPAKVAKFVNEVAEARNQFAHTILPLNQIFLKNHNLAEWAENELRELV